LQAGLAEYVRMDAADDTVHTEIRPQVPGRQRARRTLRAVALLASVIIVALAFTAYRQPDLLLNIMGLRYCG
jgi:hypothetical protein